jgi:hypothetical protein
MFVARTRCFNHLKNFSEWAEFGTPNVTKVPRKHVTSSDAVDPINQVWTVIAQHK